MSAATISARIKLARKMAGLPTQASLIERIGDWGPSRLGNYEAAISTPGPEDILRIAEATETSPCWLMFGHGPIRPARRDLQAIRHQNLSHVAEERARRRGGLARLARAMGITKADLQTHLDNPFLPISDTLAQDLERHLKVRSGWADEQHIEHDPICASFPDDLRELMLLYSGLAPEQRSLVLRVMTTLCQGLPGTST